MGTWKDWLVASPLGAPEDDPAVRVGAVLHGPVDAVGGVLRFGVVDLRRETAPDPRVGAEGIGLALLVRDEAPDLGRAAGRGLAPGIDEPDFDLDRRDLAEHQRAEEGRPLPADTPSPAG